MWMYSASKKIMYEMINYPFQFYIVVISFSNSPSYSVDGPQRNALSDDQDKSSEDSPQWVRGPRTKKRELNGSTKRCGKPQILCGGETNWWGNKESNIVLLWVNNIIRFNDIVWAAQLVHISRTLQTVLCCCFYFEFKTLLGLSPLKDTAWKNLS